jgi:hypothetical protein
MKFTLLTLALMAPLSSTPVPAGNPIGTSKYTTKQLGAYRYIPQPGLPRPVYPRPPPFFPQTYPKMAVKSGKSQQKVKSGKL